MRVTSWSRASTRLGRLRKWWAYRVRGHQGELCDRCGRQYGPMPVWWCDDDGLWCETYRTATGSLRGKAGLLCPACFIRFAPVTLRWHASRLVPVRRR